MYKKLLIGAILLLGFVSLQTVLSLECYSCHGNNRTCSSYNKVTCTETTANATVTILKGSFQNVPDVKTSNFDCLVTNYTHSGSKDVALDVLGCIYRETSACSLQLNTTVASKWVKNYCSQCSGNLCNERNPAGTFSSSLFTLFATLAGVMVAKRLM